MPKRPLKNKCVRILWTVAALVALVPFISCKTTRTLTRAIIPGSSRSSSTDLTEVELRDKLGAFYVKFAHSIEGATFNAAARTDNVDLQQRLIQARLRTVRVCRETVFQRKPQAAFLDTWALCLQLENYLKSPAGPERFGEAQPEMLKAAERLRNEIEELGKLFLKPEQLADVREKLEKFAQDHSYSLQREINLPSTDAETGIPQLGWLLNIPLSPFHALEGVDRSATAMHEFTFVASGIAQTARDMPRELSWEMQGLLLQAQRQAQDVLAQIDEKQTNTQATLREVRQAIAETRGAMADLNTSLAAGHSTADAITESIVALEKLSQTTVSTLKQIRELYPPRPESATPTPPTGRPFDILDYARTAQEVAVAATNLTRLLVESRETAGADEITRRINEAQATLAQTQIMARNLVNHIALLAVGLIIVFFGLLAVYRRYSLRLQRSHLSMPDRPAT